jgi:hypothetical protein
VFTSRHDIGSMIFQPMRSQSLFLSLGIYCYLKYARCRALRVERLLAGIQVNWDILFVIFPVRSLLIHCWTGNTPILPGNKIPLRKSLPSSHFFPGNICQHQSLPLGRASRIAFVQFSTGSFDPPSISRCSPAVATS